MLQKVEEVKRPLKLGERFLVPCIVHLQQCDWVPKTHVTPVFNHPHTDKENGQHLPHYHADYRFIPLWKEKIWNHHPDFYFVDYIRFYPDQEQPSGVDLRYFELTVRSEDFIRKTDVELIAKSKLKHKCIHKGKCPHRGFPLNQVAPVDGVITCPLHSLQFNAHTGELINR